MKEYLRMTVFVLVLFAFFVPSQAKSEENNMALTLEKQLIRDEGISLEVYLDHLGKPTVGVGHLVTPKDRLKVGQKISRSRAVRLFRNDLEIAKKDAKIFVGADTYNKMSKDMKDVVTNMSFNLGATRLGKFKKFKAALQSGNYKLAAMEMRDSKWYNQVPNRAERLIAVVEQEALDNENKVLVAGFTREDGTKVSAHYRTIDRNTSRKPK